jgi:hypothetical protein
MPNSRVPFRFRHWLASGFLAAGLCVAVAPAQAPPPGVQEHHTRLPSLSIPFSPNVAGSRVQHVELYVSVDSGRTWQYVTQMPLSSDRQQNKFRYTVPNDGTYWFAVRSIDQNNQGTPQTVDQLQAGLVVHLDRRPPLIQLKAAAPTRPDVVGVEWDVREEHFDPQRFTLEYRVPGQSDWAVQAVDPKPTGTQYWQLTAAPKIEVRLRAADKAGNESETSIMLLPGGGGGVSTSGNNPNAFSDPNPYSGIGANNSASQPQRSNTSFVNSTNIAIPFRISNVGVSGVPVMDLWVTRNMGRTWQKVPRPTDDPATLPTNPGEGESITKQFTYNAPGEGLYGFTIVVRSGVGIGDADPRPGDQPKRLIEVDTTKPEVQVNVYRGSAQDVRNVTIEWNAKDKNLLERPVSLLWSKSKDGPDWEPIIGDLDARGRYVWSISDQGPFQFYVQVRAADKAGNVGSAIHAELMTVDLNRPTADFLDPVPIKK